jgi:hypothetical protein
MPEQKPITNSRDTQELLRDAGVEVMRIMSTYREKTSLLHDYGYYEVSLGKQDVRDALLICVAWVFGCFQMQAAERAKQMTNSPDPQGNSREPAHHHHQLSNPGPPPIIVPTIQRSPPTAGFVKTFNPTGPPSITNTRRFAVTSRGAPQAQPQAQFHGMNNNGNNGNNGGHHHHNASGSFSVIGARS